MTSSSQASGTIRVASASRTIPPETALAVHPERLLSPLWRALRVPAM